MGTGVGALAQHHWDNCVEGRKAGPGRRKLGLSSFFQFRDHLSLSLKGEGKESY